MSASDANEPSQASGAGASNTAQPQESLEDLLNTLHKQIRSSDWLQQNTAEKWMEENPEAAKELTEALAEKKGTAPGASPPATDSQEKV